MFFVGAKYFYASLPVVKSYTTTISGTRDQTSEWDVETIRRVEDRSTRVHTRYCTTLNKSHSPPTASFATVSSATCAFTASWTLGTPESSASADVSLWAWRLSVILEGSIPPLIATSLTAEVAVACGMGEQRSGITGLYSVFCARYNYILSSVWRSFTTLKRYTLKLVPFSVPRDTQRALERSRVNNRLFPPVSSETPQKA